jgi:hypothetical protein
VNENDKDRCVALSQPAAVEGWKLVPVEPTEAMLDDGHEALDDQHHTGRFGECPGLNWSDAEKCYRAMLSAAPPPPSAPVQQSVREAFEQYVKDNWFIGDPTREYELSKALSSYDGEYIDSSTRSAWKQWQAALSTSPLLYKNEQAEGEEDPISRVHVVCDDSDGLIAYSSVVAGQLLFIRDCLEKRDVDGAMFALLHLSDPYLSKADGYEWSRMEEINKAPQPPQQEVIHSASKDAHDSNQLVEATLKLIAILEKGEWHGEGTMGELDGCDVCIAIHEAKTALAQSPSVGLNTKKGG